MPTTCKTERFIGNASIRPALPPQVGHCGKGMPSFRGTGDLIFVSKHNINKQFAELNHFVPVYMDDNKLMYCGNDKPSVDTPVQIRLYQALPNINYMIHSCCYKVVRKAHSFSRWSVRYYARKMPEIMY